MYTKEKITTRILEFVAFTDNLTKLRTLGTSERKKVKRRNNFCMMSTYSNIKKKVAISYIMNILNKQLAVNSLASPLNLRMTVLM